MSQFKYHSLDRLVLKDLEADENGNGCPEMTSPTRSKQTRSKQNANPHSPNRHNEYRLESVKGVEEINLLEFLRREGDPLHVELQLHEGFWAAPMLSTRWILKLQPRSWLFDPWSKGTRVRVDQISGARRQPGYLIGRIAKVSRRELVLEGLLEENCECKRSRSTPSHGDFGASSAGRSRGSLFFTRMFKCSFGPNEESDADSEPDNAAGGSRAVGRAPVGISRTTGTPEHRYSELQNADAPKIPHATTLGSIHTCGDENSPIETDKKYSFRLTLGPDVSEHDARSGFVLVGTLELQERTKPERVSRSEGAPKQPLCQQRSLSASTRSKARSDSMSTATGTTVEHPLRSLSWQITHFAGVKRKHFQTVYLSYAASASVEEFLKLMKQTKGNAVRQTMDEMQQNLGDLAKQLAFTNNLYTQDL